MVNEKLAAPHLSEAPEELLMFIRELSLHALLNEWKQEKHHFINCRLDGFLDGKSVPFTAIELDNLTKLQKSFRLTNLQLFNPLLKKFCQDFEQKTGHVLAANLYYTPHKEAQCFDYHFDSQHTFVYQLLGNKTWTFPKVKGNFLKETHEQEHILNSFKKGKFEFQEENFQMQPGSMLEFPYCLIHKARNEADSPSAHITFSYHVPTMGDLVLHYFESVFKQTITNRYMEPMSLEEVKAGLTRFPESQQEVMSSFKKKFKADQELKKIEGRRYQ